MKKLALIFAAITAVSVFAPLPEYKTTLGFMQHYALLCQQLTVPAERIYFLQDLTNDIELLKAAEDFEWDTKEQFPAFCYIEPMIIDGVDEPAIPVAKAEITERRNFLEVLYQDCLTNWGLTENILQDN